MKKNYSLSIVMPVFNESEVIASVIKDFAKILNHFERPEFIIVDDHSADSTQSIIKSSQTKYPYIRLFINEKNKGHGPSLIKAYKEAKGDFIFHCDSDNQFYTEDFWLLWDAMSKQNFDAVIGYRKKRYDSLPRIMVTKLLRFFIFIFFGEKLIDSNSPFKLHTRRVLSQVLECIPENAFVPSILMAIAAEKLNFKIGWVDVRHKPRLTGKSFIKGWKIFKICGKAVKEVLDFKNLLKKDLPK